MAGISYRVFVVDDEESIRDAALYTLTQYRVEAFASGEEAVAAAAADPPDLVLQDIGLPGMDGLECMRRIRADHPQVLFIMITAWEDVETVVRAMRQGAYDYVVKPLHLETLQKTIANALETLRLRKEVQALHQRLLGENLPLFIAESDTIQDVMAFVRQVAASPDAPVMIVGETGTGKELVAGAVHYQSPVADGPLVTVNCAAIPDELIESELFGYEPGAFSGASPKGKRGLIEEAAGGTLFLDEVGDLSAEAQAKLLRFLDSGRFYKVGGTKPRQARARVVSATNRDLEAMIADGGFRSDLYFRLGVIRVEVPSLQRRPEDVLPIARHFLVELADKYGKEITGLSPEAEELLQQRAWPGNVRELKAVMERAVLAARGPEIGPDELTGPGSPPGGAAGPAAGAGGLPPLTAAGLDLGAVLEQTERRYLAEALELAGGSDARAAELLGLNYHTFRYRKKKLGLA
jgi:DNA-binding NtrC family response regulator